MIARSYILANLNSLNGRYNKAKSIKESLFYSKLAILELCGWIEESMDDIILRCSIRYLKEKANLKYVSDTVVKRNYGFEYDMHFRKMLIQLLGIINVERVEKKIDSGKLAAFVATLETLKTQRIAEAHTHIKGILKRINAPSMTISQFPAIYNGLMEYDATIRKMRI